MTFHIRQAGKGGWHNSLDERKSWNKTYLQRKKMEAWVKENGDPTQDQDEAARDAWLKNNKITICPPFGHNDPQWGSLTKGSKSCRRRSR